MPQSDKQSKILTLVAIAKFLKAAMLIAASFGIFSLLHGGVQDTLQRWTQAIRVDPDSQYAHSLISWTTGLSDAKLKAYGVGTILYSVLFTVEGVGLLLRKRWAEYLTVISTSGFLPVEAYEVIKHIRLAKIAILIVNLLILIYLIARLRMERRPHQQPVAELSDDRGTT